MKNGYRHYINLCLLIMLLLVSACRQSSVETVVVTAVVTVEGQEQVVTRIIRQTRAVTPTPNPVRRVVALDLAYASDIPNIDPQAAESQESLDLVENLFAGLTNFNPITNQVEPELAVGWETSRDGRVWTFHLRDDIYWLKPGSPDPGQGNLYTAEKIRPITASDVVFAIQRACSRSVTTPEDFILFLIENCQAMNTLPNPSQAELDTIGVRALDDTTLQFSLVKPSSYFLTITTTWLFKPLPVDLITEMESENLDWQASENLWTSGPFMPVEWDSDKLVLHRNPEWPIPRLANGNVDVVNIFLVDRVENIFTLWEAKQIDVSPIPSEKRASFLQNDAEKALLVPEQTLFYLGFNFDSGVFREPEMRWAFNAAIDRERLVEEIYDGRAVEMRHLIPPGVVGTLPLDEVGVGYNPDLARQWLAESGFTSCRLMPPITYLVSTADLSLRQAELIRDMWVEELGCSPEQIVIEQVPFGTKLANTRRDAGASRPDIWELAWATAYPDAHNWVNDLLHCTDSENRQNRPCGAVDELIRQASLEMDQNVRVQMYREIENNFFGGDGLMPIAPLYVRADYWAVQSWVTVRPVLFGGQQFDLVQVDEELKRLERSR
jgi:ABC-type oligopeptide transport system substrate-binding subunit